MSNQLDRPSYLIDTNIVIKLEDDRIVKENYASFFRIAAEHKIRVFIHEATRDDIARDKNTQRREISLSKTLKYSVIPKRQGLQSSELEADFGRLKNDNDVTDAILLHAIKSNTADFLVTEDKGLHNRVQRYCPELEPRILLIADAIDRLKKTYESQPVLIRNIEEITAYEIDHMQPFFDSLRKNYSGFDQWWENQCVKQHRSCWVVRDNHTLAGLVVPKDEDSRDTDVVTKADKILKILKICTFKVDENKRGMKLGELLLKKILWHAQRNGYDLVYMTTYSHQISLINLFKFYGFCNNGKKQGELIYERCFASTKLSEKLGESVFETDRKNYPRFIVNEKVHSFIVPIQGEYHDTLYPDFYPYQRDLFPIMPGKSGNTIRKVYLCRARSNLGNPGSILFFYKSQYKNKPKNSSSQAITALGILENMAHATSVKELMLLTSGRSVYTETELMHWKPTFNNPVKVINYLLVSYIDKPIKLPELRKMNIVPPQSICKVDHNSLHKLLSRINLEFEV